jgi:hypothetical protein
MDEAISRNDFDNASKLSKCAHDAAAKTYDKTYDNTLRRQVENRIRELPQVEAATKTLMKAPNDPDANTTLGRYRCFAKGDWYAALPMLAKGSDNVLKDLAAKDLQQPTKPEDQVAVGDAWWDLAKKDKRGAKEQLQGRAAHWYRQALPGLSGLEKDKVEGRLKSVEPEPPGINQRTCLLPKQGFMLGGKNNTRRTYPLYVPKIQNRKGILEIGVHNMGDNTGNKGMHCELWTGKQQRVFREFRKSLVEWFKHEVTENSRWIVVLEDNDTRPNGNMPGNGGEIEVWINPE